MVYMSWFHSWHAHPYVAVLHYVSQEAKQRRSFVILVHGIDSRWRWEASSWRPVMCQQQHKCWMDWLFLLRMICLVGSGRVYGSTNLSLLCFATLRGDPIQLFLFAFTTLFFYYSSSLLHSISSISCSLATMLGSTSKQLSKYNSKVHKTKCLLLNLLKGHKSFYHVRSPSESYTQT